MIAAVREALANPAPKEADGFLTTRELVDVLKIPDKRVRPILRQLWAAGLLESKQVQRQTYAGSYTTAGYRIKKEVNDGTPD